MALFLRFLIRTSPGSAQQTPRLRSYLQPEELQVARRRLISVEQARFFGQELESLRKGQELPRRSPLRALHPYLDVDGLLCVGGRLHHLPIPEKEKHPPTMPKSSLLSKLFIAQANHQCGLSAGPILCRTALGRGHKSYKAYISLFVCMTTRAIHLEVVSALTTAAFLAAFRRFTARRGVCAEIYSDNGTNFCGADAELTRLLQAGSAFYGVIGSILAKDGTTWTFIPPSAPHWGGLWEAGVKSMKGMLARTLGDRTLTYEELSTLPCQIEACLNSRPLASLSSDPSDLAVLTPGHFLTGSSLFLIPEPEIERGIPATERWRLLQQITQDFWRHWTATHITYLQQRSRWQVTRPNLAVGDLVLVADLRYPPSKWPLGRITAVRPGDDGLVRSVVVRTASGTYTRPITKLCKIPDSADDLDNRIQQTSGTENDSTAS